MAVLALVFTGQVQAAAGIYNSLLQISYNGVANQNNYDWGSNLGVLTSFTLHGGANHTFKNSGGNVCSGTLYWRVYEEGATPGSFNSLSLNFNANAPFTTPAVPSNVIGITNASNNGVDQRWQDFSAGIDILAEASLSGVYGTCVLEVYFEATGENSSGGCSQTFFNNNGGINYQLYFEKPRLGTGTGNWSSGSSWSGGVVPTSGEPVAIASGADITLDVNATVSDLRINSGGTFSLSSQELSIAADGRLQQEGTFNANTGKVIFDGGSSSPVATVSGLIDFYDVDLEQGVDFGSNGTVNHEMAIFNGGFVSNNPPNYASSSTLIYRASSFVAGGEWVTNATSGAGVPANVSIAGSGDLDFGTANAYRQCNGDFTIESGGRIKLSTVAGGDLRIGSSGDWINENTTVGAGLIDNNRAIRFVGSSDQTMSNASGTTTIGYLLNEKTSGDLILDNNLVLDGTSVGPLATVLQLLGSSDLDLNGYDITITGDEARAIQVDGGSRSIISNNGPADITFEGGAGNAEILPTNGGNLNLSSQVRVEINKGVVFNNTTINGELTLENNGFCANVSPTYGAGSKLSYQAGFYTISNEWTGNSTTPGSGQPDSVLVYLDLATDVLTINQNRSVAGDLRVRRGAVQVEEGFTLTVDGALTNHGVIELQSVFNFGNNSATASLIQNSTAAPLGSGTFRVQRNTGEIPDITRYQYWSSPVGNAQMDVVFANTDPNDRYTYDESIDDWVSATTAVMTPGRGYITTPDDADSLLFNFNETRTFEGTVNNGNVNVNLSGATLNDFLLLGNPYPSVIDPAIFVSDNPNLLGTLWFWNDFSAYSSWVNDTNDAGDYATWNAMGSNTGGNAGDAPDDFIQSCQGFFAQIGPSSVPASVAFNNGQRLAGNNDQFFKREVEDRQRFWLRLESEESLNAILVGLAPEATVGFDRLYDGPKLSGNQALSFYSLSGERALAIQGLPLFAGASADSLLVPLGYRSASEGAHRISLDSLNHWPEEYGLTLVDRVAGRRIDLRRQTYVFENTVAGSALDDRFYVVIDNYRGRAAEAAAAAWDQVQIYQREGALFFTALPEGEVLASAELVDLGGGLIAHSDFENSGAEYQWTLPALSPGVYLVRYHSRSGDVATQKVLLP